MANRHSTQYKGNSGRGVKIHVSQGGNGHKLVKVRVLGRTKVRVA